MGCSNGSKSSTRWRWTNWRTSRKEARRIRYLDAADIARANEVALGRTSSPVPSLLQAAASRPRASAGGKDAYPDLHLKAAALFHAIARDHPFPDGNKRTAVLATFVFYGLNGWWVKATQDEVIDLAVGAATGELSVEDIAKRLGAWAAPITEEER